MSNVHIELGPRSSGKVVVDGFDVAPALNGITVNAQIGHAPRMTLDLRVHDATSLDSEHVQVFLDRVAATYLERAGWTPPPGVSSVLKRDIDGCPCEWIDCGSDGNPDRMLGRTVPTCPVHGVNAAGAS